MKLAQRIYFAILDHENVIISNNGYTVDLMFSISDIANSIEIEIPH